MTIDIYQKLPKNNKIKTHPPLTPICSFLGCPPIQNILHFSLQLPVRSFRRPQTKIPYKDLVFSSSSFYPQLLSKNIKHTIQVRSNQLIPLIGAVSLNQYNQYNQQNLTAAVVQTPFNHNHQNSKKYKNIIIYSTTKKKFIFYQEPHTQKPKQQSHQGTKSQNFTTDSINPLQRTCLSMQSMNLANTVSGDITLTPLRSN